MFNIFLWGLCLENEVQNEPDVKGPPESVPSYTSHFSLVPTPPYPTPSALVSDMKSRPHVLG